MAYLTSRSVFVHIPKTAGQWVATALARAGLLEKTVGVIHASPDELDGDRELVDRPFMFAFVRHPLAWYQSMFAHRVDEHWEPIDDPDWFTPRWIEHWATFTESCRAETFVEFVDRCLSTFPDGFVSALYDAYTDGCTDVGKQEHAARDLVRILRSAGERFEPRLIASTPERNVRGLTPVRQKETAYPPGLAEAVLAVERRALERFGYEQDPLATSYQLEAIR